MPERSKKDTDKFIRAARKRLQAAINAEGENRGEALEDLKFYAGDQWPSSVKAERMTDRRPCLTVNRVKAFVRLICNEQRQNRPAIKVAPVGSGSDKQTARMLAGMVRYIERESNADVAYDWAFEAAVVHGVGYWRIVTEYCDDETFDQSLRIRRIVNPFTVYLDPAHQQPDGSDLEWAFVSEMIDREDFKERYPGADTVAWDGQGQGDDKRHWATEKQIRVAEYFYMEKRDRELVAFQNGPMRYVDEMTEAEQAAAKLPNNVRRRRTVEERKIKWCKMTAHEILEEGEWPGSRIPIIPVIGEEIDQEGKKTYSGLVRSAKDAQRMYNYWVTAEAEMVALAPKAPYIGAEGQFEGHESQWKQANNKSYPYLQYKPETVGGKPLPPPRREPGPQIPAGIVQAKTGASEDLKSTTGMRFDATLQERLTDESAKAIEALRRVGDTGSFHFIDNLTRSLRYTGQLLVELIPLVYDTKRVVTILREDGSEEAALLDPSMQRPYAEQPATTPQTPAKLFNPKVGKYDVTVTTGPSYATQRREAAESMLAFARAVPNLGPTFADLIAKNMDWPGADEIAGRLAKTLPPHMLEEPLRGTSPQVQGLVHGLQQQLQQMSAQMAGMQKELADKQADRTIERERIAAGQERAQLKAVIDLQKELIKQNGSLRDQMLKIGAELTKLQAQSPTMQAAGQAEAAPPAMPQPMPGGTPQ